MMAIPIFKTIKPGIVFRRCLLRCINSYKLTERDVEEIQIPVPWGHISGKWWGDRNEPPVVAIHGWQDNANSFDKLIPLLNVRSVLAIDLPGHGLSSHFPKGMLYDFLDLVVALHRVKVHFGWPNMPLLAHSLGAVVGYVYAALFPPGVKWLISTECIRCVLSTLRYDCSKMPLAIDEFLTVEKSKAKKVNTSYKLSQLISMYMEGSFGSISHPEKAFTLLKRVLLPSESIDAHTGSGSSEWATVLEVEKRLTKTMSVEEQKDMQKYFESLKLALNAAEENFKNFKLDESDDKYYILNQDPPVKLLIMVWILDEEYLLKAAERIKCPILSVRTKDGFLNGATKKLYERTLDALKATSPYLEHHDIDGTHHVHLCEPESLAQIINNFIKKF